MCDTGTPSGRCGSFEVATYDGYYPGDGRRDRDGGGGTKGPECHISRVPVPPVQYCICIYCVASEG
jgi:hypothetical protein